MSGDVDSLLVRRPSGTLGEAAALRTIQQRQPAKDARAVRKGGLSNQSGERPARRHKQERLLPPLGLIAMVGRRRAQRHEAGVLSAVFREPLGCGVRPNAADAVSAYRAG
jgi:hypothetical protein